VSKLHEARLKLRGELEAPPALRQFGSGWISGVLGLVLGVAGLLLVLALRAPGLFPSFDRLFRNLLFPKRQMAGGLRRAGTSRAQRLPGAV